MQTLLLLRCLNPTWTVGLNHWSFASKEHGNSWNGQLWLMRPLTSSLFIASQPKKTAQFSNPLAGWRSLPERTRTPVWQKCGEDRDGWMFDRLLWQQFWDELPVSVRPQFGWVELSRDICSRRRTRCTATTAPDDGTRQPQLQPALWHCLVLEQVGLDLELALEWRQRQFSWSKSRG